MQENRDLLSMLPEELESFVLSLGESKYRAGQLFLWMCKGREIADMVNLPASLREKLQTEAYYSLPKVEKKLVSQIDGTVKFLFSMHDGELIESVVMHYEHGTTICVSSQAGCRMGCRFCASTLRGKTRDLLPGEILGQVIVAGREIGERIDGIVLMGIGEPLDNYDNVIRFLRLVGHPKGLNIGYRHISLSTCGLVERIYDLAGEDLPITLSISLHAPNDEERSAIMPINRKYGIDKLLTACHDYFQRTGRRISFEYTLISGVNDTPEKAEELASVLKKYMPGMPLHVNLIPVNPVEERGFVKSPKERVAVFQKTLGAAGVNATVRRKLGADINASCGQLRHKEKERKERDESE